MGLDLVCGLMMSNVQLSIWLTVAPACDVQGSSVYPCVCVCVHLGTREHYVDSVSYLHRWRTPPAWPRAISPTLCLHHSVTSSVRVECIQLHCRVKGVDLCKTPDPCMPSNVRLTDTLHSNMSHMLSPETVHILLQVMLCRQ